MLNQSSNLKFRFRLSLIISAGVLVLSNLAILNSFASQSEGNPLDAEYYDREVDSASMGVQETAIRKLEAQVQKFSGSAAEPDLLFRLANLEHRAAVTEFRVAHGYANKKNTAVDLTKHQSWLRKEVATLTRIMTQYPTYRRIPEAFFARAKAYRDLGEKQTALKELIDFASKYSNLPDAVLAHIYVAEIAFDAGDFKTAIDRLNRALVKSPDDGQYAFITDRLAQAHFNIGDFPNAMKYIELLAAFDKKRAKEAESSGKQVKTNQYAHHLDGVLQSATYYYATAIDRKDPGYTLDSAMEFFERVTPEAARGKTFLNFGVALRAKNLEHELIRWKDQVIKNYPELPESPKLLTCTYSAFTQWGRYGLLSNLARDLNTIYSKNKKVMTHFRDDDNFVAFQRQLLETAERIQATVPKDATEKHHQAISTNLTVVLNTYLQITEPKNPMVAKVRYRLAEHYYDAHDFERATTHYTAIIQSSQGAAKGALAQDLIHKAKMRRISARYEVLREKGVLPAQLQASEIKEDSKETNPALREWIGWLDQYTDATTPEFESFAFEADRMLYASQHQHEAMARIETFIKKYPNSKFVQPGISLVVDTWVVSKQWDKVIETVDRIEKLMAQTKFATSDFGRKLLDMARDARFKLVEDSYAKKDWEPTKAQALEYIKHYPESPQTNKAYAIAASCALSLNKKDEARELYTVLIKRDPQSEHLGAALLLIASDMEEKLEFLHAAREFTKLVELPPSKRKLDEKVVAEIRTKILLLSMLSGVRKELDEALDNTAICRHKTAQDCERYEALQLLVTHGYNKGSVREWLSRSLRAKPLNKVLFATMALAKGERLGPQDLAYVLERVIKDWDAQDALGKFAMIPLLSGTLPKQFAMERSEIAEKHPLTSDPIALQGQIKSRIKAIEKFELKATEVVKLPLIGVRSAILAEVSDAYLEFSSRLAKLKAPRMFKPEEREMFTQGMLKVALPYEDKGLEILNKAYELASAGVEPRISRRVFALMDKFNPSKTQGLKPVYEILDAKFATPKMMLEVDPEGAWLAGTQKETELVRRLTRGWMTALSNHNWARVGYFVQRAGDLNVLSKGVLASAKAVSLVAVGAAAEGMLELKTAAVELAPRPRARALVALVAHHFAAVGMAATREWTSRLVEPGVIKEEYLSEDGNTALVVAAGARWSGQYLPESLLKALQARVATSDELSSSAWGKFVLDPLDPRRGLAEVAKDDHSGGNHEPKKK